MISLTAIISDSAKIGKNVSIGNFCIIEENVEIGPNTKIGDFSVLRKGAIIGADCSFTAYCEIRENVVIGNRTTMGSRCTISANAIIGDNVSIKYGFVLTDTPDLKDGKRKVVGQIGDNTLIGANVTLMPGFSIGCNCLIGANTQVRCNIPDEEIWYGVPAKFHKKNV